MAKIPKTLQFHDQVARLIQAYADKKGSNFQRVVQAAVLQFFFSDLNGPDENWMAAFVELEKSKDPPLDLSQVPVKFYEDQARRLERKLQALRRKYANEKPKTAEHAKYREDAIQNFVRAIEWARNEAGVWRAGIELWGGGVDGAIEQAIASYEEYEARLNALEPPNLDDE